MLDKERGLYIAHCANGALSITGKMANRHGLIAGATGTGKTVTLQVMARHSVRLVYLVLWLI